VTVALTPISKAERALMTATTPKESKEVEAMAAAARAWAKEQENFELIIDAFRIYFLARCRTTELVKPNIKQGRPKNKPDIDVRFLSDFGFDYKQFSRRKKELALRKLLDAYIDECILLNEPPSIKGIIQFATMPSSRSKGLDAEPQVDIAEELKEKWGVDAGQIWRLGSHRLACGDSSDPQVLGRALNGVQPDCIITDPPYGMDLDTDYSKMPSTKEEGNKSYSPVIGDDAPFDYQSVILRCDEEFWFGADYYSKSIPDDGSWLVWDKRVEERFDQMIGSAFELIWSKKQHKREIIRYNNTLFSGDKEARDKLHPTIKPVRVIEWIIGRHCKEDAVIADLYSGSGTTVIASENMDCKCIAIEIEPKYVAVTLERWLMATGAKPLLLSN
jgi:DNA modification methylase